MIKLIAFSIPAVFLTAGLAINRYSSSGAALALSPPDRPAQGLSAPREELPSPREWMPFEADVRVSSPGKSDVTGNYYRSADGSARIDTGVRGAVMVISIQNVASGTWYLMRPDGWWTSGPMKLPRSGWRPPRRVQGPNIELYPFRLSFRLGQEPTFFAQDGFSVYRVVNPGGDVRLEAPDLNWFALVRQSITGRREEYTNVRIADQSPELFVPPPGAVVTVTNELNGIISVEPGEPVPAELSRIHEPHTPNQAVPE